MGKCIIIAPLYKGEERDWLTPEPGDLVLCADGGYDAAVRCGITPDLVIGDFDSMPRDHVGDCPVIQLPVHKDDTDMVVCLREARNRGYHTFRMAGCLGGRLDHTIANLQCLHDCALRGEEAWMADAQNRVTVLTPGSYRFAPMPGRKFSLLAYTPQVTGITLRGTLWELENASLDNRWPLGTSNEATGEEIALSFTEGALIVTFSGDAEQFD